MKTNKTMIRLCALVISALTVITLTSCRGDFAPLTMTDDEVESKILNLESQVAELQSKVDNVENAVDVPDGTVKTSYEELLAVCQDIFSQTVTTELECIEDPSFSVPEGIDTTGFISATWRTNDSDTNPSFFVTIWYDATNVTTKTVNAPIKNIQCGYTGAEDKVDFYFKTLDDGNANNIALDFIYGWYGILY